MPMNNQMTIKSEVNLYTILITNRYNMNTNKLKTFLLIYPYIIDLLDIKKPLIYRG